MIITIDKRRLEQAIKRSPQVVKSGALIMMRDTMNTYWRTITNTTNKWQVGSAGGGSPVDTGNLLKAHTKKIEPFKSVIYVNTRKTKTKNGKWNYAELVHNGTRKMEARPWLRFAEQAGEHQAKQFRNRFLKEVVDNLAK